jgi:predicted RNA binding protein YcfA (HicA-like mRNA interferase family)
MAIKFKEVMKMLEDDGWYFVRQRGSHRQYKHPLKKGLVTVAYHSLADTVPAGTLGSILKQADIQK